MNVLFEPPKLEEKYTDEKYMKKKYGPILARGMSMFLGAINDATSAYDIKSLPWYHLDHKKGNLKNFYSVSLDNKKSKWRLMIQMLDEDGNIKIPGNDEKAFLKSIKRIKIKELSEHYNEY